MSGLPLFFSDNVMDISFNRCCSQVVLFTTKTCHADQSVFGNNCVIEALFSQGFAELLELLTYTFADNCLIRIITCSGWTC